MHQAKCLPETECFVRLQAGGVVQFRVARDFSQMAGGGPMFRGLHQFPAESFSSEVRFHKPTFEIGDSRGHRAIDTVANRNLGESSQPSVFARDDEHGARPRIVRVFLHLADVHCFRAIGPKRPAQAQPFGPILGFERTNRHIPKPN